MIKEWYLYCKDIAVIYLNLGIINALRSAALFQCDISYRHTVDCYCRKETVGTETPCYSLLMCFGKIFGWFYQGLSCRFERIYPVFVQNLSSFPILPLTYHNDLAVKITYHWTGLNQLYCRISEEDVTKVLEKIIRIASHRSEGVRSLESEAQTWVSNSYSLTNLNRKTFQLLKGISESKSCKLIIICMSQ